MRQIKKKQEEKERGMKREKRMAAALGMAVILGMTGCAGSGDTPGTSQENVSEETGESDVLEGQAETDGGAADVRNGEDAVDALATQEGEWVREEPVPRRERRMRSRRKAAVRRQKSRKKKDRQSRHRRRQSILAGRCRTRRWTA